jgi:hypothetical protein
MAEGIEVEEQTEEGVDEQVVEQVEAMGGEEQAEGEKGGEASESPQPERLVVTIGDKKPAEDVDDIEEEHEDDTPVIKKIRTAYRNKEKEIRDTRRELAAIKAQLNAQAPQVQTEALTPEPTMDDDDVLYNTDKFKTKMMGWLEKKAKHDAAAAEREVAERAEKEKWTAKMSAYKAAREDKRFDGYEDAEFSASNLLNTMQQSIIIQECKDPKLVFYALGKNASSEEAKRLAAIKNPVSFAIELGRFETKDIIVSKKPSVLPEKRVSSSGSAAGVSDSSLERAREKAVKSGGVIDVTSSLEIRRAQRSKR